MRRLVHLARLNLLHPWPMRGPFHAVFCRNVMMYFDQATREQLVRRFWNILAPGGILFVGHAESLARGGHAFRYVMPSVYEKTTSEGCSM